MRTSGLLVSGTRKGHVPTLSRWAIGECSYSGESGTVDSGDGKCCRAARSRISERICELQEGRKAPGGWFMMPCE